jgi:hypothetical protein
MSLAPRPARRIAVLGLVVLMSGAGCRETTTMTATTGTAPPATAVKAPALPAAVDTAWPDSPGPKTLIVARAQGIFEVSTVTGRDLRRLTAIPRGYSPEWVRADREHGRVFFGLESCDPEPEGTWVVPLAGGRPRFVTEGGEVSVSPDGRLIAFPRIEDGCAAGAIVVRDLVTGRERTWHPSTGDVNAVVWAPDGRHLAFGSVDQGVHLLDTAVPEQPGHPVTVAEPLFVAVGTLKGAAVVGSRWILLVERPCPEDLAESHPCGPSAQLVDGRNGQVVSVLPPLTAWHPIALDGSGRAVLLGRATDGVIGRYGVRSVVPIGPAVAGDW